jgi:HD-GYP domain-containing protein (c-di-GMP phosphodiesterase class II)
MITRPPDPPGIGAETVCLCRGELLAALAQILDRTRRPGVSHHARVAVVASRLAPYVGGAEPLAVFYAALIHDIGASRDSIDPPHLWNLQEQANQPLLRSHPLIGAQIAAEVPGLLGVAPIILDHHEWANGHGYPRGKRGGEIGPAAQVLRLADTCDMVLREQAAPDLVAFIHAIESRTRAQVDTAIAHSGTEALGEPGLYPQLLTAEDVDLLVQSAIRRLGAEDFAATDAEVTDLLELFGHLTDAHPADKIGHSRRVAALAVLVAMAIGLSPRETTLVKWAALVHDVGLVDVPKTILDKPGLLDENEIAEVRRHAATTEKLLQPVHGLEEVARVAASHGEAFDGSGYPRGLQGRGIPIGGRILAVCDTFDALTSRRPYREARDTSLAIDILVKGSGSLFDPDIVASAVPVFLIANGAEEPEPAGTH